MNGLKLLVALLGALIVLLMTVMGYGLYRKASDPDFRFFDMGGGDASVATQAPAALTPPLAGVSTPTASSPAPLSSNGFGTRDLGLVPGTEVREITAADGRLYIHVRLPSGLDQILILNAADGRVIGTVNVNR